jgi:hypothetical protein
LRYVVASASDTYIFLKEKERTLCGEEQLERLWVPHKRGEARAAMGRGRSCDLVLEVPKRLEVRLDDEGKERHEPVVIARRPKLHCINID